MHFLNFGMLYIFDVGEDMHLKCATKMDYDNPHRGVGSVTCSSFTTLKPSKKIIRMHDDNKLKLGNKTLKTANVISCCGNSLRPMYRALGLRIGLLTLVKAKFHYAIWSQTSSKLVADLLARAR